MTADEIIIHLKNLPLEEIPKVLSFLRDEDLMDTLDAHFLLKEFQESGEKGIPAEEVFRQMGIYSKMNRYEIFSPPRHKSNCQNLN